LHDISLKWKLLIPFLFLASAGATALFAVSYRFQADLIYMNEERWLTDKYRYFLSLIKSRSDVSLSLAHMVATNSDVCEAFAKRDRRQLMSLLRPAYKKLSEEFGIKQFHFHVPPATSFLRLHLPGKHGDKIEASRMTIKQVGQTGQATGGLEKGVSGFGIRGVVPVFYDGSQIGTVELGSSLKEALLEEFRKRYSADLTLYVPHEPGVNKPKVFASTLNKAFLGPDLFSRSFSGEVVFNVAKRDGRDVAIVAGPVRDFSSKIVAVAEVSVDRSPTLALLKRYGFITVVIGLIGLALSISFVWFISVVFTKRIEKVVGAADEIAAGHRDTRIELRSADELGIMAHAINEMLGSLEESRRKIKDYAENLELMVEQRTLTLKESEQTYRTLVEHVPLIVYLVMADGTAMYLNRFSEQTIGLAPKELSGHYEVWTEHIHPNDRARVIAHFDECLSQGKDFSAEYRIVHKDGHIVHVFDHAVPVLDDNKKLVRMDGIVVDVTVRKELQEKIVQAEELETLSGVSARLAHEIRNPLTSIGGLTRRLLKSFGASDERSKKANLIVEEVEKLERLLRMMTAYIEPRSIQLSPCNLNEIVSKATERTNAEFRDEEFSMTCHLDSSLQKVNLDCNLFEKVLVHLVENAFYRMNQKGKVEVTTRKDDGYATVTIAYEVPFISDEDLEHFFYPFIIDYPFPKAKPDSDIMDVPICRVVIHKHGGIVNVSKEGHNLVKITISLPLT
jgi:PAS domain S-box-containing protein